MELSAVTLDDKYTVESGRIYLSGIQALVRLPLVQRNRDRAAGLKTGGFISGYRGSPLGSYDTALWHAKRHLAEHDIHFQPGLNEDLAATSVWGSQQVPLFPGARADGVFAIWYGKGPGVDRSMDPMKHANMAGSSRLGGVLCIAGDDHGCQSSTTAHQSEQNFLAAMLPVVNPATVQEYLDFGQWGFALSRFSGCWIGFIAISETVESSASVWVDPARIALVEPADFEMPPGGLNIRWPDTPLEQERRLHGPKMAAVAAFARANPIDRLVLDPPQARLGIMATGKAWLDVRQALAELGIDDRTAAQLGIRLYKVGLSWPLESEGARRFAQGLDDVLVVEEKRGFVEDQLTRLLYHLPADRRPSIAGKTDEAGAPLLPSAGELGPTLVAHAIAQRLQRLGAETATMRQRLARLESFERLVNVPLAKTQRTPYFCSGCPHNTSTRVPEGSRALAGIGCHFMVQWVPNRNTATFSHMGGEGAAWIGQAPWSTDKHIFQNLGDGTYQHSGLLAIRAAAAAGVNITYKILYNDAVAMTGGQPVEGHPSVGEITREVLASGAKKVVVVTDEPDKYGADAGFAPGTQVHHRDELDAVQRELREVSGLTVLVYDQTCAAEKRRRRKRGLYPDPPKRVVINEAVCEGCGDCSEQSNCVSVKPLETEFGRKRTIDQSSCNKDFSCLKGFCPSFVTVHGAEPRRMEHALEAAEHDPLAHLPPAPAPRTLAEPFSMLVTGIGGTGVITVGALIGMAAHLEGKGCTVLDFTGLAQKNGAVMSHVRIAGTPDDLYSVRIAPGGADLVLGCDLVVAASPTALSRVEHGVTRIIANSDLQPTAAFVLNGDVDFEARTMERALSAAAGSGNVDLVDATGLATSLMGDSIATNLFMLGYAFQKGMLPLGLAAIERAIELNGVAVEANKHTFNWGRLAAHDHQTLERFLHPTHPAQAVPAQGLPALIERRAEFLAKYQDKAYARHYREFVARVAETEKARVRGHGELAEAAARGLFKLMAYKDEYEVARLYTDGAFRDKLKREFDGKMRLEFHLAPPVLAKRDPLTGHLQKRAFGSWMLWAFAALKHFRFLRGTSFDPFGRTPERRMERQLIADYEATLGEVMAGLNPENHVLAVELAALPERIRGFGHVKERAVAEAKTRAAALLAAFRAPVPTATATE
ncbi:MAG TPA: indolepyruvate ferredoxin oxidoreductase family protein [Stellaceae bacterium]|nr:indolepyruvate ferredoxin oxidoreductase family protein [Stellaceae bacterium]